VRILQTGPSLAGQHHAQYGDFEEDSHGIVFICNNEEGISLLTHPRNFFKKGEGEIHVLLPSLQSICIGNQFKQRVNYRNPKEKSIKYDAVVGVLLFIWMK
jgi:hypothetical protein